MSRMKSAMCEPTTSPASLVAVFIGTAPGGCLLPESCPLQHLSVSGVDPAYMVYGRYIATTLFTALPLRPHAYPVFVFAFHRSGNQRPHTTIAAPGFPGSTIRASAAIWSGKESNLPPMTSYRGTRRSSPVPFGRFRADI
jgi:hypothetical protein